MFFTQTGIVNRYIAPIQDPEHVNKRRKAAGFDNTVEENAKRLGIVYKEYTYKQINEITKPQ